MTAPLPDLSDHFDLGEVLGSGSFGEVRLGRRRADGLAAAIKVAHPGGFESVEAAARTRREAALLAGVQHPNLVTFLGVYQTEAGALALAYSLVEGQELAERLRPRGLPAAQVSPWVADLARGLGALHAAGLRHRDVKCENVRLDQRGRAVLLDFGLAKPLRSGATLTATGMVMGSPHTLSPEELRGEPVGPAGDQYSLGCLAYRLLTGAPPFPGHLAEIVQGHLKASPPQDRLSPELYRVLARALGKHPEDRYPSVDAFAAALQSAAQDAPGAARSEAKTRVLTASPSADRPPTARLLSPGGPPPTPAPRFSARNVLVGVQIVALLGLLLGWLRPPPTPPPVQPLAPMPAAHWTATAGSRAVDELRQAQALGIPELHPAAWVDLVEDLPTVKRFYTWVGSGGAPEELPAATLAALRAADQVFRDAHLPEPFYPFAYLRPHPQTIPADPEWVRIGLTWVAEGATGWTATALLAFRDLLEEAERADEAVAALAPDEHPFPAGDPQLAIPALARGPEFGRTRYVESLARYEAFWRDAYLGAEPKLELLRTLDDPRPTPAQRRANVLAWLAWTRAGRLARRRWDYALGRAYAEASENQRWGWYRILWREDYTRSFPFLVDASLFVPWELRSGGAPLTPAQAALRSYYAAGAHIRYYRHLKVPARDVVARRGIQDALAALPAVRALERLQLRARLLSLAWRHAAALTPGDELARELWEQLPGDLESLDEFGRCRLGLDVLRSFSETLPDTFCGEREFHAFLRMNQECEARSDLGPRTLRRYQTYYRKLGDRLPQGFNEAKSSR